MTASLAAGLPTECMAGTFQSHGWLALAATILGLLGAIYSLSRGFLWLREEANCRHNHTTPPDHYTAKSWLLGMWVLLPPVWLYIEHVFLYRRFGKAACLDSFQHAQQIVSLGWIVVVAVLILLYFGREIFGRD